MRDAQTVRSFKATRKAIRGILRRCDPIGLIRLGAPPDEYDPEVGTIMPRLEEATSQLELRRIVHEEFVAWFGAGTAGAVELYDRCAAEIWEQCCGRAGD